MHTFQPPAPGLMDENDQPMDPHECGECGERHTQEYLENMRSRLRWAADDMTNAYSLSGAPYVGDNEIRAILAFVKNAESNIQTAKQFLALYTDAEEL